MLPGGGLNRLETTSGEQPRLRGLQGCPQGLQRLPGGELPSLNLGAFGGFPGKFPIEAAVETRARFSGFRMGLISSFVCESGSRKHQIGHERSRHGSVCFPVEGSGELLVSDLFRIAVRTPAAQQARRPGRDRCPRSSVEPT